MDNGFMKSIRDRVLASANGSVFTSSDFADIADTGTIRQSLNRLVQEKILRRIIRGVFEKPKYSKLLEEYVAVSPENTAACTRLFPIKAAVSPFTVTSMLSCSAEA